VLTEIAHSMNGIFTTYPCNFHICFLYHYGVAMQLVDNVGTGEFSGQRYLP